MNSDKQVLASIALKGDKFIQKIKQRSDIRLFEMTHSNRDRLPESVAERLR
ncbi:nucleoside-triphosphatase [Thermodesulfobacteriota bacterium]